MIMPSTSPIAQPVRQCTVAENARPVERPPAVTRVDRAVAVMAVRRPRHYDFTSRPTAAISSSVRSAWVVPELPITQ